MPLLVVVLLAQVVVTTPSPLAAVPSQPADVQALVKLEQGKWDPQTLGGPAQLMALFADDLISVEYGTDIAGGVRRKSKAEVFGGPPLPPAKFDLIDWKVLRPSINVVILSYRVTAKSFRWNAFATSVWAQRNGEWKTIFYQASTAK